MKIQGTRAPFAVAHARPFHGNLWKRAIAERSCNARLKNSFDVQTRTVPSGKFKFLIDPVYTGEGDRLVARCVGHVYGYIRQATDTVGDDRVTRDVKLHHISPPVYLRLCKGRTWDPRVGISRANITATSRRIWRAIRTVNYRPYPVPT